MLPSLADTVARDYGQGVPIWNTEYNVLIQQQANTSASLLAGFQVQSAAVDPKKSAFEAKKALLHARIRVCCLMGLELGWTCDCSRSNQSRL